jgi:hypothetical protein
MPVTSRAQFRKLAVRCAVEDAEQHRSAVLHDDVDCSSS